MSNKLEFMEKHPNLYQELEEAAKRTIWLSANIIFCAERIELYFLELDQSEIVLYAYYDYEEDVPEHITADLDSRAGALSANWKSAYMVLSNSWSEGWALDLTQKDYAILEVGERKSEMRYIQLPWSFEGLKKAAQYVSDLTRGCFNPEE